MPRTTRTPITARPSGVCFVRVPSRRVAQKLDFRYEGERREYLHIDGAWRDHLVYVLLAGDIPEGVLERWRRTGG